MRSTETPSSDKDNSQGLTSYLSRASGWFNPFNYLPGRNSRVIASSFIFLQQSCVINAITCFQGKDIPRDTFMLNCLHGIDASLYESFKDACGGIIKSSTCNRPYELLENLGRTVLGGVVCDFSFNSNTNIEVIKCLKESFSSQIPSNMYGSTADIIATVGICLGGVLLCGVATCGFFRFFKPPASPNVNFVPLEKSNDLPEAKFEALKAYVAKLKENDIEDARLIELEAEMKTFEEEYRDPIELNIMSQPYQINCEGAHIFELSSINKLDEEQGCPCCRREFNKAVLTRREDIESIISLRLDDFEQRSKVLTPASEWEMTEVRVDRSMVYN